MTINTASTVAQHATLTADTTGSISSYSLSDTSGAISGASSSLLNGASSITSTDDGNGTNTHEFDNLTNVSSVSSVTVTGGSTADFVELSTSLTQSGKASISLGNADGAADDVIFNTESSNTIGLHLIVLETELLDLHRLVSIK